MTPQQYNEEIVRAAKLLERHLTDDARELADAALRAGAEDLALPFAHY